MAGRLGGLCRGVCFRPVLVKDQTSRTKVYVDLWGTGIFQLRRQGHMGCIGLHKEPTAVLGVPIPGAALQGQIVDLELCIRAEVARGPYDRRLELCAPLQIHRCRDHRRQQWSLCQQVTWGKGVSGQLKIEPRTRAEVRHRAFEGRLQA
jgi:hypothetical protein